MKKLLFILMCIFIYSHVQAKLDTLEWEYMGSPGYGNCDDFGINSKGHLFFCGNASVERSTDAGETWQEIFYTWGYDKRIVFDSQDNIYLVHVRDDFILFSSDNGNKWDTIAIPLYSQYINFKVLKITETDRLYVCIVDSKDDLHILYSDNKGKTWDSIPPPQIQKDSDARIVYINDFGSIVINEYLNDGKNSLLHIHSEADTSWKVLNFNIKYISYVHLITAQEFYIVTNHGLYHTENGGDSIAYIGPQRSISTVYTPTTNEIYVGTIHGMAYSSDKGKTWQSLDNILDDIKAKEQVYPDEEVRVITRDNTGRLYAAPAWCGFRVSTDNGETWKDLGSKLNCSSVSGSNLNGTTFDKEGNFYAFIRGIHKSTDNGRTWQHLGFKPYWHGNMYCTSKGTVLASSMGGIHKSTDNGQTWTTSKKGYADDSSRAAIFSRFVENKKGIVFGRYAEYNIVTRTFDEGETWESNYTRGHGGQLAISTDDELFDIGEFAIVWRSKDDAITWEAVSSQSSTGSEIIKSVVFHPKAPTGYAEYNGVRWITTDNGNNWQKMSKSEYFPYISHNIFIDSTNKYCFSDLRLIFGKNKIFRYSPDFSNYDTLICIGLKHTMYGTPFVSPDGYYYVFVDYGGVYRTKQKVLSVDNSNISMSKKPEIKVYPNPTNTETEITYAIHSPGRARLVLYNLLGLPITVITDSYIEAGIHSARISTAELPAGAYFLRLECGGESVVAPVWVVK